MCTVTSRIILKNKIEDYLLLLKYIKNYTIKTFARWNCSIQKELEYNRLKILRFGKINFRYSYILLYIIKDHNINTT